MAPGGRQWRYEWDAYGRLLARIAPSQATSRYTYDEFGHLASHTGPRGAATRFGYDRCGGLVIVVDALGNRTQYVHDARGEVILATAAGLESRYERDPDGRLTRVIEPGGQEIHCACEADGNLVRDRDAAGHVTCMMHTALGEIGKRSLPDGNEVEYRYNSEGQPIGKGNRAGSSTSAASDMHRCAMH